MPTGSKENRPTKTITARVPTVGMPEEVYWRLKRVLIEPRTILQDWILVRLQAAGAQGAREMMCASHGRDT